MVKKFLIALGAFLGVAVVLGIVKAGQLKESMAVDHTPPPSAVTTAEALADEWHPHLEAIGTLAPVHGVLLTAEVDGTVTEIAAENGASVKKGDVLLLLDTSIEEAQLAGAKARAELARLQYDRSQGLLDKETISQAELDAARAQLDQAIAEVGAIEAAINKKHIRAPFPGRVGIRSVNLGQYVSRGQALLPLQQLDPIFVNFTVPQRQLPLLGLGQTVRVTIDAFPGRSFDAEITAINPQVDSATRNVAVQATLPNPQELLRAGMFAQVEVVLPQPESVVVIPATAVAYAPYGNSVFVVEAMKNEDGTEFLGVRQLSVKVGEARGDLVSIDEGLQPGQRVVTSGIFKLRNRMPVEVNNTVRPANELRPTPANT